LWLYHDHFPDGEYMYPPARMNHRLYDPLMSCPVYHTFSNVVIFGSLLDPVIQFERESQPKIKGITTKKYCIHARESTWMGRHYVLIAPHRTAKLCLLLLMHKYLDGAGVPSRILGACARARGRSNGPCAPDDQGGPCGRFCARKRLCSSVY